MATNQLSALLSGLGKKPEQSNSLAQALASKTQSVQTPAHSQSVIPSASSDSPFTSNLRNKIAEVSAPAHKEVLARICRVSETLGKAHPEMPRLIVEIKKILNENGDLAFELTKEELACVVAGMREGCVIKIAEAAAPKKRGPKQTATVNDIL